jgi:iron complex outermembrane receptor protein
MPLPILRPSILRMPALAVLPALLLAAGPALRAQPSTALLAAQPAAPPAAASAPQTVEITGSTTPDSNDERRRATASRITYGREELDRMGDASLGEVLKRLPGVTLGGPPGRGGQVRMRGMGAGYTQILIDGQRMAPGFSLDSIAPEQIEKIEIMRAPVAEYGTRAIAGTINVVMRSDFKRKANEFKLGGGADGSRPQAGASWATNGQTDSLGYNLSATVFQGGQDSDSETRTLGLDADGNTTLDQRVHNTSEGRRRGLFANARLQWRLGPGQSLDLQPFLNLVRSHGNGLALLDQPVGADVPYTRATSQTDSTWQLARLAGSWNTSTDSGGRLLLRFGGRLSDSSSQVARSETGGRVASAAGSRQRQDDSGNRELSLDMNGKFSQLIADRHSASAGWELEHTTRDDRRRISLDGAPILTGFGENLAARVQRLAAYAQDEWEWSKQFSFYLGARWEAIDTRSDALPNQAAVANRSAVFAPLAHMVWKFPDAPRDQLRLSLTRSYRSPNLNQLIARPTWSSDYDDLGKTNTPTKPDRVGNPALKPELSWGLEMGYEHYLDAGGVLSANVYVKRIDDLIRNLRSLETVPWATVPRWVARPQNLGQADAAGLELEAKARLQDLWAAAPAAVQAISLRANASLMWSRLAQVPGPDNRLEGQPPWTANLGVDWPVKGLPLTVGASLNFTPAYRVQEIDDRFSRQGVKPVLDLNALWKFSPDASLRLTVSNASAHRYDSGSTSVLADGSSEATDTRSRTTTNVNLRAEFRF